ncbi:nuclear transport factor 2 family protein [Streptomyces kaniharaensis]|uniref:Nuclear transport factor 2 family protein n=1 Tax=Streptomyces kaniharaensis TaxID=212423 RepID=A0A6N7KTR3_9ACTN|nr:nuclear transport factor 2 family protein [Streptomyces kaniharaensis]MQS13979.1 nuclear transport factor 2 family protein [Streptomyces kaniharaensis]
MTTMAEPAAFDTRALREGIERSDAESLLALYADDAELRMVDRKTQPSHPLVMHGREEIGAMLNDLYGREMTHKLEQVVVQGDHVAFMESCRYPDGVRVLVTSMADLRDGRIVDQTSIQAWDEPGSAQ